MCQTGIREEKKTKLLNFLCSELNNLPSKRLLIPAMVAPRLNAAAAVLLEYSEHLMSFITIDQT